ncbi:glycosyltransferase [Streptomyces orinoci]|uniref:D-inositol 3-phosphate glycosyltransferase n=1 Tax=Streptomyces orinoci TaxID=67339 RepID=A0ABV3K5V4_STRON|nr:glycosyltransferase [Streptomyces orinoci]
MSRRNLFLVGIDVDSMGGSQRVLHTLAQGFAERGHRVELIGIRPSPEPHTYLARPAYRHTTLYRSPPSPRWEARSLRERLDPVRLRAARAERRERDRARSRLARRFAAVPHGFVVMGSPWAADWLEPVARPRLKGIGQYHESYLQACNSDNLRLILRHYPGLEKSVFLSEADAEEFRRQRLPNAVVLPNPLPFAPGAAAPLDTRRVGAVGRLDPVKRLDRLLDAFAAAELSDWELHFFGDGPVEGELRAQAVRLGIAERVRFRGVVRDVAAAYRELSVLALTSEREGRPMALAEASAVGVPCVSFDLSGGVRELVAHGETGVLVPPGDVRRFAAGLRQLMTDSSLRRRYGAAARVRVAPLGLPEVLDRWEGLFEEIER